MFQHIIEYYGGRFAFRALMGCNGGGLFDFGLADGYWHVMCAYMRLQGDYGDCGSKAYRHPPPRPRHAARARSAASLAARQRRM